MFSRWDPPPYREWGTGPFDAPRSPSFGAGARFFADDTLGRRAGRAWQKRAAAGELWRTGEPF